MGVVRRGPDAVVLGRLRGLRPVLLVHVPREHRARLHWSDLRVFLQEGDPLRNRKARAPQEQGRLAHELPQPSEAGLPVRKPRQHVAVAASVAVDLLPQVRESLRGSRAHVAHEGRTGGWHTGHTGKLRHASAQQAEGAEDSVLPVLTARARHELRGLRAGAAAQEKVPRQRQNGEESFSHAPRDTRPAVAVRDEGAQRAREIQRRARLRGGDAREDQIPTRAAALRVVAHRHQELLRLSDAILLLDAELLPTVDQRARPVHRKTAPDALAELVRPDVHRQLQDFADMAQNDQEELQDVHAHGLPRAKHGLGRHVDAPAFG